MAIQFRLHEGAHQISGTNIDIYKLYYGLYRIESGTYYLPDYRLRGFFNHHFPQSITTTNTGYIVTNIQGTQGISIYAVQGYNDWMDDVRPPRIDSKKFASEIDIYFPNGTLNSSNPYATDGQFSLMGAVGGGIREGRYNDVQESYSYLGGATSYVNNPSNWILEHRINEKTKSIQSVSSIGSLVTVTTTTAHGYSNGNAIRITGFGNEYDRTFGASGERYSGTFTITVTGANTFTYHTKHVVTASTHTGGTCEYWEAVVHESRIASIQGNGTGTITISNTDAHNIKSDDIIAIGDTTNYNGYSLKVLSSTSTSIVCTIPSNVSTVLENTGVVYHSSPVPSSAIPINYAPNYTANQVDDHRNITRLVYADKDTYINTNDNNGHGGSLSLQVTTHGTDISKALLNFPIDDVVLSDLLFAEVCAYYQSGSDDSGQLALYQMSNDTWSDSGTYATLNPLIVTPVDQVGSYAFGSTGSRELNTYTKFTVSTQKILNWLKGIQYPSVALVKVDNEGITNLFLSTENTEYKPYLVISSGTVSDISKPTLRLTDSFMYLVCSSIQGNGSGTVSITTTTAHLLNAGDVIHLYNASHYEAISAVVLGGSNSPTTYTFSINIPNNSSSDLDTSGIVQRTSTIKLSAIGYDETEISDESVDIAIRKSSSLVNVDEYNVIKSSDGHSVTFDFNLVGLQDGIFDLYVKDMVGNQSLLPFNPPVIMDYYDENGDSYSVMKSGRQIYVNGFNVDLYNTSFTAVLGDVNLSGGIITGGINITVSTFNNTTNSFAFQLPTGLQAEYLVSNINVTTNEMTLNNASIKVGDIIAFNSIGDFMQPPLQIGVLYFVKTVTISGSNSIITLSNNVLLTDVIDLTTPLYTVNMVASNIATPLHILRDGFDTYNYNNRLYIRIDEYAPKIYIPPTATVGDTVTIVISDLYSVDTNSISFINGTQVGSGVDKYGDGRVYEYQVTINNAGTFAVRATDTNGNVGYSTLYVSPVVTPFIEVTGYTINSATSALLNIKVTDPNISAIVATTNSGLGVFVEGSTTNTTYGTIKNLASFSDGITFDIDIIGLGDGIMKIYANDNIGNSSSIIPPVLTSVTPDCLKIGSIAEITGINLSPNGLSRSFVNPNIQINETYATNKYLRTIITTGIIDGVLPFILHVTEGQQTLLSNAIEKISDNSPPIITLIDESVIFVTQNDPYVDMGATAQDDISGNVTSSIVTTGNVNTAIIGTYYITYTATDGCGNSSSLSRQVNVGTGCPIYIQLSTNSASVGQQIIINATVGLFNPIVLSNIVTVNGIIAQILSGDRNHLIIVVPNGATTGYVQVETGPTNTGYENCSLSNVALLNVEYPDESFDTASKKSSIISIFNNGVNGNAIYNRDLAYSNFVEVTDENSMVQNLFTILLTRIGNRFFNPNFGSTIEQKLFSIVSDYDSFESDIMKEINRLIIKYEPRIILIVDQSFVVFNEDYNEARIILSIKVPTGNIKTVSLTFKNVNNNEVNI